MRQKKRQTVPGFRTSSVRGAALSLTEEQVGLIVSSVASVLGEDGVLIAEDHEDDKFWCENCQVEHYDTVLSQDQTLTLIDAMNKLLAYSTAIHGTEYRTIKLSDFEWDPEVGMFAWEKEDFDERISDFLGGGR